MNLLLYLQTTHFFYHSLVRQVWIRKDDRPVVRITRSHQELVWFGATILEEKYDCDESMTSENLDVVTERLFSTMNKYHKSIELDKLNIKNNQGSDEVKINVITPIYDQKDVELLTVIAVVLGEYQIKKIDINDELEKANEKNPQMKIISLKFHLYLRDLQNWVQYNMVICFLHVPHLKSWVHKKRRNAKKKKIHKRF